MNKYIKQLNGKMVKPRNRLIVKGGRPANNFRKSKIRKFAYADFLQMWHFADLWFEDPVFLWFADENFRKSEHTYFSSLEIKNSNHL